MAKTKTEWKIVKMLEKNAIGINCSEHFKADKIVVEEIAKVRKTRHAKYNINYHIVWIPKTRAKILNRPFDEDVKKALMLKCETRGWNMLAMQLMPDHVHISLSVQRQNGRRQE